MTDISKLKEYATERQLEILEELERQGGNQTKAAEALGLARGTVFSTLKAVEKKAEQAPVKMNITKTSTLYDAEGNVRSRWVTESKNKNEDLREQMFAAFSNQVSKLPAAEKVEQLNEHKYMSSNLLSFYPIVDLHMGLRAWAKETGVEWNTKIAQEKITKAMALAVYGAPSSKVALIGQLGDFFNADNSFNETPTSKHRLDEDGRRGEIIEEGFTTLTALVECALRKHEKVVIFNRPGNHDPDTTIFITMMLKAYYRNEDRVIVDESPSHFSYYSFGKNLLGFWHGNGAKPQDMPLIMANDVPDLWGASKHRYIHGGHIHHKQILDIQGTLVESHQTLSPNSAYLHQMGYRSGKGFQRIDYHPEWGEVNRQRIDNGMLF